MLAFTSIIFGGTDSNVVDEAAHLIMCKVNAPFWAVAKAVGTTSSEDFSYLAFN